MNVSHRRVLLAVDGGRKAHREVARWYVSLGLDDVAIDLPLRTRRATHEGRCGAGGNRFFERRSTLQAQGRDRLWPHQHRASHDFYGEDIRCTPSRAIQEVVNRGKAGVERVLRPIVDHKDKISILMAEEAVRDLFKVITCRTCPG